MTTPVIMSTGYYPDPTIGKPVSEGYIYAGEPDTDPTVVGNQKTMKVLEEDGSLTTVAQPLRTSAGGVPVYNGSPVTIMVAAPFSVTVLNKSLSQVYYVPTMGTGDVVGDVLADDGTVVLDNGTDGTDATLTADITGDLVGDTTGDHIGEVQADDLTTVLDPGADGSAVVLDAGGISGTAIKDEDDMVSDSDTHLATQQSIKAYTDTTSASAAEGAIRSETFTADGTFDVPVNIDQVFVTFQGGGGGAAGGNTSTGGGGGASGTFIKNFPLTVTPEGTVAVTVGLGGAGATAAGNGTAGGDTIVGALTVSGGNAGLTNGNGGAGEGTIGRDVSTTGGDEGVAGGDTYFFSGGALGATGGGYLGGGGGGASMFGDGAAAGGGNSAGTGGNGNAATAGTGAGGGGGGRGSANGGTGGDGSDGFAIISW